MTKTNEQLISERLPEAPPQAYTIGERIRERRQIMGFTLKTLAMHCGLSIAYLSDLERGRTLPSLGALQRIAYALRTSVTNLLEWTEYSEIPPRLPDTKDQEPRP